MWGLCTVILEVGAVWRSWWRGWLHVGIVRLEVPSMASVTDSKI